jgi:hypothetical protein
MFDEGTLVTDHPDFRQTPLNITEEEVREMRNKFLKETDWWACSDLTMTAEQTAYRQALRDITNQANFPDITWPTKP